MQLYPDCYLCFMKQALNAAQLTGMDNARQIEIMRKAAGVIQKADPTWSPPEVALEVHRAVRAITGNPDPYREAKQRSTEQALAIYPELVDMVSGAGDPCDMALRLSIAGNIIDLSRNMDYDLWDSIERAVNQPFAIDDRAAFWEALDKANTILYLGDNAGETVFDRLFIETLDRKVIYVVRGAPALNDVTWEDAQAAGLDEVATLVSNGLDAAGTVLHKCSEPFKNLYADADMIISKGQGNFETLTDEGPKIFFLFQVKCPAIVGKLNVPQGSIVVKQGSGSGVRST
jgi:uncharacterized protein with ATP-grasp and redox domains